jgi:hypothetical protein
MRVVRLHSNDVEERKRIRQQVWAATAAAATGGIDRPDLRSLGASRGPRGGIDRPLAGCGPSPRRRRQGNKIRFFPPGMQNRTFGSR